jgi:hypothetical protein
MYVCEYQFICMNEGKDLTQIPYPSIHPIQRFSLSFFSILSFHLIRGKLLFLMKNSKSFSLIRSHTYKANLNNTKKKEIEIPSLSIWKEPREKGTLPLCYIIVGVYVCEPSTRTGSSQTNDKEGSQWNQRIHPDGMHGRVFTVKMIEKPLARSYQTRSGNTVCHKINSVIIIIKMWIWHSQLTEL